MSDFDPGKTTGVREASPTSASRLVDCFPPIDLVFLINNQQERAAIDVNRTWLSAEYLLMLASNGNGFDYVKRFDDTLPGWGSMKRNDQFYVGDFNADGLSDLYVFNGPDWSMPYLLMLASTGSDVRFVQRFDRDVPGWGEMRRNDRWFVADVNGDRRSDLYVYNALDWSTAFSSATSMAAPDGTMC